MTGLTLSSPSHDHPAAANERLSIGAVSGRTGLSVDTLRFYEREGLFPPVQRNASGRRVFTADDVAWIKICQRLRTLGMPLPEIARYAALVRAGAGHEGERLELLKRHEAGVRRQIAELQEALDLIAIRVTDENESLLHGTARELVVSHRDHAGELGIGHHEAPDAPARAHPEPDDAARKETHESALLGRH